MTGGRPARVALIRRQVAIQNGPSANGYLAEWMAPPGSRTPTGHARADLARLKRDCGTVGAMRSLTPVGVHYQSEEQPAELYELWVTDERRCYRIYAAADSTVRDLDLPVRGQDADPVAADVSRDGWPVLPPGRPLRFLQPGRYVLEVSVARGRGYYALQVWGR
jgi:hypothetical protein